ncbi:hypothetical protein BSKO_08248 [Bryopsis sp. KO-2023]|nr:hypothetical protein BSKO_08248 [Bryopsis sp. KO-2023]
MPMLADPEWRERELELARVQSRREEAEALATVSLSSSESYAQYCEDAEARNSDLLRSISETLCKVKSSTGVHKIVSDAKIAAAKSQYKEHLRAVYPRWCERAKQELSRSAAREARIIRSKRETLSLSTSIAKSSRANWTLPTTYDASPRQEDRRPTSILSSQRENACNELRPDPVGAAHRLGLDPRELLLVKIPDEESGKHSPTEEWRVASSGWSGFRLRSPDRIPTENVTDAMAVEPPCFRDPRSENVDTGSGSGIPPPAGEVQSQVPTLGKTAFSHMQSSEGWIDPNISNREVEPDSIEEIGESQEHHTRPDSPDFVLQCNSSLQNDAKVVLDSQHKEDGDKSHTATNEHLTDEKCRYPQDDDQSQSRQDETQTNQNASRSENSEASDDSRTDLCEGAPWAEAKDELNRIRTGSAETSSDCAQTHEETAPPRNLSSEEEIHNFRVRVTLSKEQSTSFKTELQHTYQERPSPDVQSPTLKGKTAGVPTTNGRNQLATFVSKTVEGGSSDFDTSSEFSDPGLATFGHQKTKPKSDSESDFDF